MLGWLKEKSHLPKSGIASIEWITIWQNCILIIYLFNFLFTSIVYIRYTITKKMSDKKTIWSVIAGILSSVFAFLGIVSCCGMPIQCYINDNIGFMLIKEFYQFLYIIRIYLSRFNTVTIYCFCNSIPNLRILSSIL